LLSLFAFSRTFFHSGAADTLDTVMQNVAHRSAGTEGVDSLQDANNRQQLIKFLLSIDATTEAIAPNEAGSLANVSAASYSASSLAAESDAIGFGERLANQSKGADSPQLSTALGGSTISVLDSAGVLRLAPLFYVSPGQINYEVPAGVANGEATITATSGSGATSSGTAQIASVAPGIFSANVSGKGVAAATAVRIKADGSQSPVTVFQCDANGRNCVAAPIDVDPGNGTVYVALYGTGIRNRTSASNVKCSLGGVDASVTFAGAQGQFVGLDQINVKIPASLKGRGEVPVIVTADGVAANAVTLSF
jgi:uncharacterized protein (TIGR03437 family)